MFGAGFGTLPSNSVPFNQSKPLQHLQLGRELIDSFRAAGLYLTLDYIAKSLEGVEATEKQDRDLRQLVQGCRDVLDDAEKYIRKNETLGTDSSGLGSKTHKAWRKLKWDPTIINQLRDRMVANISYLNAFNNNVARSVSLPLSLSLFGIFNTARTRALYRLTLFQSNLSSNK